MTVRVLGVLALVASGAGCYSAEDDLLPCGLPVVADGDMEMEAFSVSLRDATSVDLADGATLPLQAAHEGGFLLVAGARVENLAACEVFVVANLRRPSAAGEPVVAGNSRSVKYRPIHGRRGWAEPVNPSPGTALGARDTAANLPACPYAGDRDVDGCPWVLELAVEDLDGGRRVEQRFSVTPACPPDPTADEGGPGFCDCQCAAGGTERACDDLDPWVDPPAPSCSP